MSLNLTDMRCSSYPEAEPDYPVAWCSYGDAPSDWNCKPRTDCIDAGHSRQRALFWRPPRYSAEGIRRTTGNGKSLSVMKARGEKNTKNIDAVTMKSALSLRADLVSSSRYIRWKCEFGQSTFQGVENILMNCLYSSSDNATGLSKCAAVFRIFPNASNASACAR